MDNSKRLFCIICTCNIQEGDIITNGCYGGEWTFHWNCYTRADGIEYIHEFIKKRIDWYAAARITVQAKERERKFTEQKNKDCESQNTGFNANS